MEMILGLGLICVVLALLLVRWGIDNVTDELRKLRTDDSDRHRAF